MSRPRLHYEIEGDGPAVVLIHEGIVDSRMWDDQVPALVDAGYRVLRYDLRGYGRSELLADAGIQRAAFVGASYGGRIALEFALSRPAAVAALVLFASGLREAQWSD